MRLPARLLRGSTGEMHLGLPASCGYLETKKTGRGDSA